MADEEQRKTNEILGAELGYIYSGSGIIPDPGAPAPASPIGRYAPSAFPGARLPNTWLKEGPPAAGPRCRIAAGRGSRFFGWATIRRTGGRWPARSSGGARP